MLKYKKFVFLLNFIFALIFSSFIVNSTCNIVPNSIEVSSGSFNLGSFNPSETIFINPNLNSHPLKIKFLFENDQNDCFSNVNNFKLKLFSTGAELNANSFSTQNISGKYITSFIFLEQIPIKITNSFVSSYIVSSLGNSNSFGSILFSPDINDPIFEIFASQPKSPLLNKNQEIIINFKLSDSGSGLDLITINNGDSNELIAFNGKNKSYDGIITRNLDKSRTYTITAKDKLGRSSSQRVSFIVDDKAPDISLSSKIYDYDVRRKISFTFIISDASFLYSSNAPNVIGNFSLINPIFSSYKGNCLILTNTSYSCSFKDIEITAIDSTQTIFININVTDKVGNSKIQSFNEEIFVDKQGPVISEFYLENFLGVEDVFSSSDTNVKVHLTFSEESISSGHPRIFTDFDLIAFPQENCTYSGNVGTCEWSLGNLSSVYDSYDKKDAVFKISLLDFFGNSAQKKFTAKLDNNFPILTTINVIETESIKDKIIKSGEIINFRVFIEDDNLDDSGKYFVTGDFSNIDFRDGFDNIPGLCSSFNVNTIQCDFNSIIVENGYIKRNVTFTISDVAGNIIQKQKGIEVFQINDEVFSSYKINNMNILNPLNRNQMKSGGGVAWFEGDLNLVGGNNISIVNYQLVSCKEENLDPLLIIYYKLFPDEIVINSGQKNVEHFAMKVELKDHPNLNDLNTKKMSCILSVLKKDSKNIYAPEKVKFNLQFSFYDIPRGSLLNANAQNILSMYDDISYLGDWFDTTYEFYNLFNGICTAVGGATSTISSVSESMVLLSFAFAGTPASLAIDQATGSIISTQGKTSNFLSSITEGTGFIKKTCDWVTCKNGAHLTGLLTGSYGGGGDSLGLQNVPGLGDLIGGYNDLCQQGGVAVFDEKSTLFSK